MIINGVFIDDTYAEAFGMKATRIVITADNLTWARHAANAAFGFATSVIACGCEAGIERELSAAETPDGRPGVAGLLFAVSTKELAKQLERRVGQCVLTCPTTAVFAGCEGEEALPLGKNLRYFGDGWQMSKLIAGRRYWRIPVMDGEFLAEETTGLMRSVGRMEPPLIPANTDNSALPQADSATTGLAGPGGGLEDDDGQEFERDSDSDTQRDRRR